jgi:hypothetical protein
LLLNTIAKPDVEMWQAIKRATSARMSSIRFHFQPQTFSESVFLKSF